MEHLLDVNDEQLLQKYKDALISLASEVLKRSLFTNENEFKYLTYLDDERSDVQGLTEVDQFLQNCTDCIEMVTNFYPLNMIPTLYVKLQQLVKVYESKNPQTTIKPTSPIAPTSPSLIEKFDTSQIPKDIQLYLRIFGRLSGLFTDQFESTAQQATQLMNELLKAAMIGEQVMLNASLNNMFLMVPWMAKCSSIESIKKDFQQLMSAIMQIIVHRSLDVYLASEFTVNDVMISASMLLKSITHTVKPSFIVKLDTFHFMYRNLQKWTNVELASLNQDGNSGLVVLENLYISITNAILLRTVDEELRDKNALEEWQGITFREFSQNLIMNRFQSILSSLRQNQSSELHKELAMVLNILSAIVKTVEEMQRPARVVVAENFKIAIENVLPLMRAFINNPIVLESLLGLMLALSQSLKVQIGLDFIEQSVKLFLDLFTAETMRQLIQTNSPGVMVYFLQLLISIVEEGSGRFIMLTDRIIMICRDVIYPHVRPDDKFGLELLPEYYKLMYSILHFNWKYFFDINILVSIDHGNAKPRGEQSVRDFCFILECFLRSFQSLDITIFGENLKLMRELDRIRKLFSRELFIKTMLGAFLGSFFTVLINKTHNLLRDDIISIMFEMNVASGWTIFEQAFLPSFVNEQSQLNNDQKINLINASFLTKKEQYRHNLQAFEQCVHQFVNDVNFLTK
jgi:hypothetical protein